MSIKRLLIILAIVIITVAILNAIFNRLTGKQPRTTPTDTTTPTPIQTTPFSGLKNSKLESLPGFVNKEVGAEKTQAYNFTSSFPGIYDQIYTRNDRVVLKTTILVTAQKTYPSLISTIERYGQFKKKAFDRLSGLDIFIYPEQGMAIAGSEQADEARYLYEFDPQSQADFDKNLSSLLIQTHHE